MLRLSPYKIGIFTQCRRRYKYHYVDNLIKQYKKDWPWLTMGQNVHYTLSALFATAADPKERTYEKAETILRMKWKANRKGFKNREEEREYGLRALDQIKRFVETQDLAISPFRIEKYHEAKLDDNLILNGVIDRIDELPDSSLHIIDYKTGDPSRETDDFQLLIYSILAGRNFNRKVSKVSNLYLDTCDYYSISPDECSLQTAMAKIKAVTQDIINEKDYFPSTGGLCKYCDFSELCDACKEH